MERSAVGIAGIAAVSLATVALLALSMSGAGAQGEDVASAWVQFGDPDQEHGLTLQYWGEKTPCVSRGGRLCRSTDQVSKIWQLWFRVDPEFVHETMPVRVTVEYWDEGTDWFVLRYNSSDVTGLESGRWKRSELCHRTDTKTWKHYTFRLPDARFGDHTPWGADFRFFIEPLDQRDVDDLLISRVEVTRGGVFVSATPDAVSADGVSTSTVKAWVYNRAGELVPDGTTVGFSTTFGRITPAQAATVGGCATATFTGVRQAGTAEVTARCGDDAQTIRIPVLEGRGPMREITFLIDDFSDPHAWEVTDTPEAHAVLTRCEVFPHNGRPVGRLDYEFDMSVRQRATRLSKATMIPGRPTRLTLWVNGDRSTNIIYPHFIDAQGRDLHFYWDAMWYKGWQHRVFELRVPELRASQQDYVIAYPLTFDRIRFLQASEDEPYGGYGTIYLQDLVITTQVPESALVWPEIVIEGSRLVEAPGQRVPLMVRVRDFSGQPKAGLTLTLSTRDGEGQRTAGPRYEFDIGADEVKTFAWQFVPPRTGSHQLEAVVEGDGTYAASRAVLTVGLE